MLWNKIALFFNFTYDILIIKLNWSTFGNNVNI